MVYALISTTLLTCTTLLLAPVAQAEQRAPEVRFQTADYHAVFHFQHTIDLPAAAVFPHAADLGSWIGFDFIHVAGPVGGEGAVYQLYAGQEFYFQVTKLIPDRLIVGVNLPSEFRQEASTGIAIVSLTEVAGRTIVSVTMSRQYDWLGTGPNPSEQTRASAAFQDNTRAMWENNFFPTLTRLATASR